MTRSLLAQHEAAIAEALVAHDGAVLRRLTHPAFTYLGVHVAYQIRWDRGEWERSIRLLPTSAFQLVSTDVQVVGPQAVVSVDAVWMGLLDGTSAIHNLVMSDFWVQEGEDWLLLRRHASISPETPTPIDVQEGAVLL